MKTQAHHSFHRRATASSGCWGGVLDAQAPGRQTGVSKTPPQPPNQSAAGPSIRPPGAIAPFALLAFLGLALAAEAQQAERPLGKLAESIVTADGKRVSGRVVGDASEGYRFRPEDGSKGIALEEVLEVFFENPPPDPSGGSPPFQALLGLGQRISGRLAGVETDAVRLDDGPGKRPVRLVRAGATALIQRPGEVQILREGFETLDPSRWIQIGLPELTDSPRLAGKKSLRLPAGGSSLTCRLTEPVGSGRLEVAFHDDGTKAEGQRWFVDLTFRDTASDLQSIRAVLGWNEDTLAVESPGGTPLAVQRLTRKTGWHRLVVEFGPERTSLAVDGDELARGHGPSGPLVEIRLATQATGKSEPPSGLAAHLDDLRLARLAEPVGRLEVDPSQDEVRLVTGDQLFGRIEAADPDRVALTIDEKRVELPWAKVSGLFFRRAPVTSELIDGLLVRLEWRAAPGGDPRDVDRIEGALAAVSESAFIVTAPYTGTLAIPRQRVRRMQILGKARRLVIEPHAHHLGNRLSHDLDPPQSEGGLLEIAFDLKSTPEGAASLVLDVLQVVGESGNPDFSEQVQKGHLRTNVLLNGKPFDYLNRHISDRNESPERIRLPIPTGLLKAGANVLRFQQVGTEKDPEKLDNLGLLTVALEFAAKEPDERPKP